MGRKKLKASPKGSWEVSYKLPGTEVVEAINVDFAPTGRHAVGAAFAQLRKEGVKGKITVVSVKYLK